MSDAPAPIVVEAVNIEAFERQVYGGERTGEAYQTATIALFSIIMRMKQGAGMEQMADEARLPMLFARLAGAITALFADPKYALSYDGFLRIALEHTTLHAIFRASPYGSMDHIMAQLGTRDPAEPGKISFTGDAAVPKMLICYSPNSDVQLDFETVSALAPSYAAAVVLGMLSIGGTLTPKAYESRVKLLTLARLIDREPLQDIMLPACGDAYMHCSYVEADHKHDVKKMLNRKLRELVQGKLHQFVFGAVETTLIEWRGPMRAKDAGVRPTIVVPLEWFGSHHAMYRCYAPSLLQLKTRFRIVGIARSSEVDDEGKAVFDKFINVDPAVPIAGMIQAILDEAPDIIYYPSLGMAAWWVALSNFRLAPIQVISPGHPASSYSDAIDAIVSDGDLFGDESNYSERCIGLPVGSARYMPRKVAVTPLPRPTDGVMRLAIPAMAMKLTPPFLATLQRIQRLANRPVEFHFFPNQVGLGHYLAAQDLRTWFPDRVQVYPRADYPPYMEWLSRCDLMLSTFPFGGTNSVIDAFLLGIPVVTLEGDQIHSRSDASMLRRVKMPEWLIAHSVDEYVAAAVLYINGSEWRRQALRTHLAGVGVEAEFFGEGPPEVQGKFVEAFWELYEEKLNANEQRNAAGEAGRDHGSIDHNDPQYGTGPVG